MDDKLNGDKEMAKIFLNMYNSCIKYKSEIEKKNSKKKVNCDEYLKKFLFFTKNNIDNKDLV